MNVLYELLSSGGHGHGTLRHVHRVQRYFAAAARSIASSEEEFVVHGVLLGHELGTVVQLIIYVIIRQYPVSYRFKLTPQVISKRLGHREHDAPVARNNSESWNKVIHPIGEGVVVVVEFIDVQNAKKNLVGQFAFWNEVHRLTGFVIRVQYIQSEILRIDLECTNVVDVLHHQIPHRLVHGNDDTLQQLHHQGLWSNDTVVREFPYLIGLTVEGVLEGYPKHLIGIQTLVQRDVTEVRVKGVFV